MKGIVLETNDKKAAVLFDNGSISTIKNNQYEIGQVINMNNKFNFIAKAGSIAAALVITTATGYAYTTPSTYVSLDVNPSIEYKLNAFDRVISVVAVNEDGEKIVNELDVNNEKIQKAILKTVEKLKAEGILTDEDYSGIVIAVSNKSEEKSEKSVDDETDVNEDEDEDKKVNEVEEDEDENEENSDIEISVEAVGKERVEEARKLNVTPGKLNLVQKLIASTDEFNDIDEEQLNELLNLSVKEINKMTQAFKKGLDVEFAFDADLSDDLDDEDAEDTDKEEVNEDNDVKDKDNNNKDKNKAVKERSEEVNDDDYDEIDDEDINDDEDNSKDINKPVKEEKENIEKSNNGKAAGKEKNN